MDKAEKNIYDEKYYNSHCGQEYKRNNGWKEIFGTYSDRIVKEINPKKTLDIGCVIGFFVESLYDRGVDAYGIDISDYAIKNVREDIKERCKVQSALIPINEKYDLITCIEVLEHLDNKDIPIAIQRMCEATEDIIFSSTPFDYDEESHISIHTPEYWAEQFAYNGFYHDVSYDCSFISVQAMRFRKIKKSKVELIRDYEHQIFQKHQEVVSLRHLLSLSQDNVDIYKKAYQEHVDVINRELNPKILELKKELDECTIKQKKESEEAWQSKIREEVLKRKEFEDMIDRIHKGEFTDLLVYHPNRIYRAEYNKEKFDNIINDIDKYAVLHSVVFEYESSPVIDKYLAVLKKENEYFEKYLNNKINLNDSFENPIESKINGEILNFLNNAFIWRKIKTKIDMHNAMNSQYKYDLLKLSDFYYDELCDLFADFYNIEDYSEMEDEKIDELFSIENYKKILENKEVPKRIKECIELYLECNKVCKELETIIIKKD